MYTSILAFYLLKSLIVEGLKNWVRGTSYAVASVFISQERNWFDWKIKELTMNTIFLILIGIAALSGLLAVMIYLLAVSREMELPDGDEFWKIAKITAMPGLFGKRRKASACNSVTNSPLILPTKTKRQSSLKHKLPNPDKPELKIEDWRFVVSLRSVFSI